LKKQRCLLNSYNSSIQTHVGVIIALIIGLTAIISSFNTFFISIGGTISFFILVGGILLASILMVLRIVYWTVYGNYALSTSLGEAVEKFNNYSIKYQEKAPNTAIIQFALNKRIQEALEKDILRWDEKWAFKITLKIDSTLFKKKKTGNIENWQRFFFSIFWYLNSSPHIGHLRGNLYPAFNINSPQQKHRQMLHFGHRKPYRRHDILWLNRNHSS
jgi:hypothetical protein